MRAPSSPLVNRANMNDPNDSTTLWSALRRADSGWLPRLGASLISGLALTATGLFGAWVYEVQFSTRHYMRDEQIAAGVGLAAAIWLAMLAWIWRGHQSRQRVARAFALSGALGLIVGGLCVAIDAIVRYEEEIVIAAIILWGSALAIWIWIPVIMSATRGRSPRTQDGEIDVHCPTCNYALNGLRDLRCPECGTTFTIDSLIEAQRYDGGGGVRQAGTSKSNAA